jgi:predicted amidophosphoribosyltransferase
VRAAPTKLLLDLVLPERCVACGNCEEIVCALCLAGLERLRGPLCARCGASTAWPVERCAECAGRRFAFAAARSAVAYEGAARALVSAWKERGLRRLAETAAELVVEVVPRPDADAVAFVPGDLGRTLWRGHSTAEALAQRLARRWGLELVPALARDRSVPRQRGLSRPQRRRNVRDAFRAVGPLPAGIILVDDVYTTGATVSAAAAALRVAGARTVHVATFARAVRR